MYPTDDSAARYSAYEDCNTARRPGSASAAASCGNRVLLLDGDLQAISASYAVADSARYPATTLAYSLRDCAALIAARSAAVLRPRRQPLRRHTHADEQIGPPDSTAFHESLLGDVSEVDRSLQADIEGHGLGDKVLTLVFSEFGRRPVENNDLGTDHGFAGPMFAIGTTVHAPACGATIPTCATNASSSTATSTSRPTSAPSTRRSSSATSARIPPPILGGGEFGPASDSCRDREQTYSGAP